MTNYRFSKSVHNDENIPSTDKLFGTDAEEAMWSQSDFDIGQFCKKQLQNEPIYQQLSIVLIE